LFLPRILPLFLFEFAKGFSTKVVFPDKEAAFCLRYDPSLWVALLGSLLLFWPHKAYPMFFHEPNWLSYFRESVRFQSPRFPPKLFLLCPKWMFLVPPHLLFLAPSSKPPTSPRFFSRAILFRGPFREAFQPRPL